MSSSGFSSSARAALVHLSLVCIAFGGFTELAVAQVQAGPDGKRPMTFLDMQHMRRIGSPTPSPDGRWLLYTLTVPDWEEAEQQTDVHLVSLERGVESSRQMTFTERRTRRHRRGRPMARSSCSSRIAMRRRTSRAAANST